MLTVQSNYLIKKYSLTMQENHPGHKGELSTKGGHLEASQHNTHPKQNEKTCLAGKQHQVLPYQI
jgi:hypothetical protein